MKIFILRHAEDSPYLIGGHSNIGLTRKGKKQANELRDYILSHQQEFNIGQIISSDLPRAVETVLPLGKALHLTIQTHKMFRALNWGSLNGLTMRQARTKYAKVYLSDLEPDESFPDGGESPNQFYERVKESWIYIHQHLTHTDKNILICTHGQQFNIFLSLCTKTKWNYKTDYRIFNPCLMFVFDTDSKSMKPIMPLKEYNQSAPIGIWNKLKRLLKIG